MEIISGLFDRMVLQRNQRGVSDTPVVGQAAAGDVYMRVGKRPWKRMASNATGQFSFKLAGLRAGGPYTLELQVRQANKKVVDRLTVRDVLVGDVWIAGGQSNMQGCARREFADKPHRAVRAFYMDDRWDIAQDPIHTLWDAVDPIHRDLNGGAPHEKNIIAGVGPAVAFAQDMHRRTKIPQAIIASAHGGTNMEQWNPERRDEGGKSLYGATVRRLKKNGGRVAGVIWYQGESDALPAAAALYTARMKTLIAAFRRDAAVPKLPFVLVQLSRVLGWPSDNAGCWNSIQDQQLKLPQLIKNTATVPAIDLSLDDSIHVGGSSNTRLGKRLAQAMTSLVAGKEQPPLRLKKIQLATDRANGAGNVILTFDHVVGQLRSGSRPTGFAIHDGRDVDCIFDTRLDGPRIILRTGLVVGDLRDKLLAYGHGLNPVCNITDEADRSLPVFDLTPLGEPRAVTPHIRRWEISDLLEGTGTLQSLDFPNELNGGGWRPHEFATDFADRHLEIEPSGPADKVVFYRCRFNAAEPMQLAALIGYDGPVKLWFNGRAVFHDPTGTNPALAEAKQAAFSAAAGTHEIVIALGTNQGRAWGVYLRLQRVDVARDALWKGTGNYRMPEFTT